MFKPKQSLAWQLFWATRSQLPMHISHPGMTFAPRPEVLPCTTQRQTVFPRLDQDSSLDGAETVSVLRCFRENFWISIYILKYKSPALSTLLISKSQGFFWGGFLP